MRKLDEILDGHLSFKIGREKDEPYNHLTTDEAKAEIKALMLELIGTEREWNTNEPYDNPDVAQGYNEAIAEVREKVENL